jgi:hypothetical protein
MFFVIDSCHIARVGERQMKLLKICLAVVVVSVCMIPAAYARIVPVLSYQELFDKSDLIVIAIPVSKTADTDERTNFQNLSQVDADGKQTPISAIGVETVFSVLHVVKGDSARIPFAIILHHYRPETLVIDGPNVVSFDPTDARRLRTVLLFLVKEQDGRYAPYGGQTDPGVQAITALESPP